MSAHRIIGIGPGDGERCRVIRLAMLQDAPIAYLETYQDALARTAAEWEARAAGNVEPGRCGFAAVDDATGDWIGVMHGVVPEEAPDLAWLVGVWVHPGFRGAERGVADALVGAVVGWARQVAGVARLLLEVHESNARAIAFYERHGFVRTGKTVPYLLDPASLDLEMELPLDGA